MKRSPLKRKSSLKARSPMKKRPRRPRGDADDPGYLEFVRTLPCCAPGCFRRFRHGQRLVWHIEAHHVTGAGMGKKARDDEAMPLCRQHHRDLHEFTGPFAGWTREVRQQWQLAKIADTRAAHASFQQSVLR